MSAQDARGVEVGFSTAQLDDAGIGDDIFDHELAEIVDDFFLAYPDVFRQHVAEWRNEHPRDDEEPDLNLEGQPEFNGAFKSW